jgi:hypothetical protein
MRPWSATENARRYAPSARATADPSRCTPPMAAAARSARCQVGPRGAAGWRRGGPVPRPAAAPSGVQETPRARDGGTPGHALAAWAGDATRPAAPCGGCWPHTRRVARLAPSERHGPVRPAEPRPDARRARGGARAPPHRGGWGGLAAAGGGGLLPLCVRPVWGFRLRNRARPLASSPQRFPPPPGRGMERTVVLAPQMRRSPCDPPPRGPVTPPEGMAAQVLEAMGGRHPGRGHRTATPWGIGPSGHLRAGPSALEPVVDGLHPDARQLRDLADGVPLGHPQHSWHALTEACICRAHERLRQSREIVLLETQCSWTLRDSHRSMVDSRSTYLTGCEFCTSS